MSNLNLQTLPSEIEEIQEQQINLLNAEKSVEPHKNAEEKDPRKLENLVGLRGFINECSTFEDALETLNSEGAKNGVAFKRGNIHYYENSKCPKDKRIICQKMSRNKIKVQSKDTNKKGSLDQINNFKNIDTSDCQVYYKFSFTNEGKMSLSSCNEIHNHNLILSGTQISQEMINDLKNFNRRTKIIDIKESLEKKYHVIIDYHSLYYEFRKIFPRLGNEDANNFIKILKEKNIYYKKKKKKINSKKLRIKHHKW